MSRHKCNLRKTRFLARQVKYQNDVGKTKPFLLVYEAVKTTINDQVWWQGYMRRVIWVKLSLVGRCVLREWVVRGGGLDGYFGEQGLPVGIQEYLEIFHLGCIDYLSR